MLVTLVALIFILDLYPTTGNIYFSSKVRVDSFGEGAGKSVLLTNQSHHVAVVTRCSIFEVCWIVFRDHHQFSLSLSKKDLRFIQKDGNNEIYFWKKKRFVLDVTDQYCISPAVSEMAFLLSEIPYVFLRHESQGA